MERFGYGMRRTAVRSASRCGAFCKWPPQWLRLGTLASELPKRLGFSRERLREIAEARIQKVVALDIGGGVSAAPKWQAGRVRGRQQIAAGGLFTQPACSKNRVPTETTFKTTTSKIQQS